MLSSVGDSAALFEGFQALPACPSDKNSIRMKMHMDDWWNDTERGNPKNWEESLL
jgi:hypothetical protein